jgi:hypothetical protein
VCNKPLHPELERRNAQRSKTRARAKIGFSNLVYNMKRFAYLVTYSPPNLDLAAG